MCSVIIFPGSNDAPELSLAFDEKPLNRRINVKICAMKRVIRVFPDESDIVFKGS